MICDRITHTTPSKYLLVYREIALLAVAHKVPTKILLVVKVFFTDLRLYLISSVLNFAIYEGEFLRGFKLYHQKIKPFLKL